MGFLCPRRGRCGHYNPHLPPSTYLPPILNRTREIASPTMAVGETVRRATYTLVRPVAESPRSKQASLNLRTVSWRRVI